MPGFRTDLIDLSMQLTSLFVDVLLSNLLLDNQVLKKIIYMIMMFIKKVQEEATSKALLSRWQTKETWHLLRFCGT
jgi:hypothetical protein